MYEEGDQTDGPVQRMLKKDLTSLSVESNRRCSDRAENLTREVCGGNDRQMLDLCKVSVMPKCTGTAWNKEHRAFLSLPCIFPIQFYFSILPSADLLDKAESRF